jgi:hypothetical protein
MRRFGDLLGPRRKDRGFFPCPTSDWRLAPAPSASLGRMNEADTLGGASTSPVSAEHDRKPHRRFHFTSEGVR